MLQVKRKILDQTVPFNESIKTKERRKKKKGTSREKREIKYTANKANHPNQAKTANLPTKQTDN